jgi:hypothetical protein
MIVRIKLSIKHCLLIVLVVAVSLWIKTCFNIAKQKNGTTDIACTLKTLLHQ